MNKLASLSAALLFALASAVQASGDADIRMDPAPIHRLDTPSLQRGARNFVNYCLNCHSAKYMRYERLTDIGLTKDQITDNFLFGTAKIGSTMTVAMTEAQAKNWFGAVPPDLSVISRVRGADWLYNYFLSFYRDDKTPTGWNNLVYPNVGMPHVLWQLSGQNKLVETSFDSHDAAVSAQIGVKSLAKVEPAPGGKWLLQVVAPDADAPGTLTPVQYQAWVADLVNYLEYMGEPAKNQRISLGIVVLMFMGVLLVLVYALKRMYWKDVH